jgi:DhnA family fructose-bisphosphate aldolase class Ia
MFSKTIKAIAIASVIAGATATAAYAYPHTGYQAQIENQINSVIAGARAHGFNLIVANLRGQMYNGGGHSYSVVYLQAGQVYRFAARCDTDCTDVDMALRGANGAELIADRDNDDFPTFTIRAPYTGAYQLVIEMARCNAYRCQVGAVVLGQTI